MTKQFTIIPNEIFAAAASVSLGQSAGQYVWLLCNAPRFLGGRSPAGVWLGNSFRLAEEMHIVDSRQVKRDIERLVQRGWVKRFELGGREWAYVIHGCRVFTAAKGGDVLVVDAAATTDWEHPVYVRVDDFQVPQPQKRIRTSLSEAHVSPMSVPSEAQVRPNSIVPFVSPTCSSGGDEGMFENNGKKVRPMSGPCEAHVSPKWGRTFGFDRVVVGDFSPRDLDFETGDGEIDVLPFEAQEKQMQQHSATASGISPQPTRTAEQTPTRHSDKQGLDHNHHTRITDPNPTPIAPPPAPAARPVSLGAVQFNPVFKPRAVTPAAKPTTMPAAPEQAKTGSAPKALFDVLDFVFTNIEQVGDYSAREARRAIHWAWTQDKSGYWRDRPGIDSPAAVARLLIGITKQVPQSYVVPGWATQLIATADPSCDLCKGSGRLVGDPANDDLYPPGMFKRKHSCSCIRMTGKPWRTGGNECG